MAPNLAGHTFGRLTVLKKVGSTPAQKAVWLCRCSCGAEKQVTAGNLRSGQITSCGCRQRELAAGRAAERSYKHGNAARGRTTGEYRCYRSMLTRCRNARSKDFHLWGGRGVTVCERWSSGDGQLSGFECFLADMGPRPSLQHSLDRWPDDDGHYEPGNVRWATPKQQGGNGRRRSEAAVSA